RGTPPQPSDSPAAPFFFPSLATTAIYTLSLHDALPILIATRLSSCLASSVEFRISTTSSRAPVSSRRRVVSAWSRAWSRAIAARSEEHTSELQSRGHLVCRLLLEKKKRGRAQRVGLARM